MTGSTDPTLAALRAHARGLHCHEAAVELLIGHASWLQRDDFLRCFLDTIPGLIDGTTVASLNWSAAIATLDQRQLPCSAGEGRVLRLAASLAEGIPLDPRGALTGLASRNAELVTRAIKHATGHR